MSPRLARERENVRAGETVKFFGGFLLQEAVGGSTALTSLLPALFRLLLVVVTIRKSPTVAVMENVAVGSQGVGEGGFLSEEVSV